MNMRQDECTVQHFTGGHCYISANSPKFGETNEAYRISSKNLAQKNSFQILMPKWLEVKLQNGYQAKVPNNWKCRFSMSCQVDTQAHSIALTFTRCKVDRSELQLNMLSSLLARKQ